MTITAADIRREVKEKCNFLRLMFSDIAGTLKMWKFQQLMNNLTKYWQTKQCLTVLQSKVCSYQRI